MTESNIVVCSDVSEQFEFVEERLVYVDAPVEGVLRSKDGEFFVFRCRSIIDGYLWHWVLLPVDSPDAPVDETFTAARSTPPGRWVSIVEDRRGAPRVAIGQLAGTVHPIPV